MGRLLLIVLAVVLGLWWLQRPRPGRTAEPQPPQPHPQPGSAPAMVACARCGVHVPQADCEPQADGRWVCGPALRQACDASAQAR